MSWFENMRVHFPRTSKTKKKRKVLRERKIAKRMTLPQIVRKKKTTRMTCSSNLTNK